MHYYTTLFDSFYLSRGVIMYRSLESVCDNFHMYIFAFDDITYNTLNLLALKKATIIPLIDFETPELKEVKKTRTKAEYCWTCTPSVISYVLENYDVTDCTYVDADLFFYSDPAILISELDAHNKNVLISEHRYSFIARLYEEKRAGRFCVQFMTFRKEESSIRVLDKWRSQCIEWCYAKHEDGKFGDQKYLDEWPLIYDNVHILENEGGGLAPWNLLNYRFFKKQEHFWLKEKKTGNLYPLVFYHFQYVKSLEKSLYDIGWYPIPSIVKSQLYSQYLNHIGHTENEVKSINVVYNQSFTNFRTYYKGSIAKTLLKRIVKFNIQKNN
jgi:hypothetical protein